MNIFTNCQGGSIYYKDIIRQVVFVQQIAAFVGCDHYCYVNILPLYCFEELFGTIVDRFSRSLNTDSDWLFVSVDCQEGVYSRIPLNRNR